MIITSKKIDDKEIEKYYTGYFSIDRKGEEKDIKEHLITSEEIGEVRAKAEFLEYGYNKQEVSFKTFFSPLKINDIIRVYAPEYRIPDNLNNDRFIVKNIKHTIKNGEILTDIKAVRYD